MNDDSLLSIEIQSRSGILGWAVILVFAAVFDCFVIHKDKQSLSQAIWSYQVHPRVGPFVFGAWLSLTYHFFFSQRYKKTY